MVNVNMIMRLKHYSGEDSYFASYNIGNIKSWIFVNIDDFYSWLERNNSDYYKVLRNCHFFFKKYTIVEEFDSKDSDRSLMAKRVLNSYFDCCYENNGLQDFNKMIDLQSMSPIFRAVQLDFVEWDSKPYVSIYGPSIYDKYGSKWVDDLINDAKAHGLNFFNDCAGHLYPDYNFRTLFYDSGSSHEIQFDRQQGRENKK